MTGEDEHLQECSTVRGETETMIMYMYNHALQGLYSDVEDSKYTGSDLTLFITHKHI
jgi:hypothetical protein